MKIFFSKYIDKLTELISSNLKKVMIVTLAVVLLFTFVFSEYGIIRIVENKYSKNVVMGKIEKEKRKSDSLAARVKVLQYDTLEIERIARELYGMVKPSEKIYIYKSQKEIKDEE